MWKDTADVEFVFVDDGSSDNTRHALHRVFGTDALSQIAVHESESGHRCGHANRFCSKPRIHSVHH